MMVPYFCMVHAGFAPSWDLSLAKKLASEVEKKYYKVDTALIFYVICMEINLIIPWNEQLTGWDRLRCITNYFTRARFCRSDGSLDFNVKENLNHQPANFIHPGLMSQIEQVKN